jgi:mitofusin
MLSKLAPAKVYLQNILEDIDWILTYNIENQSKLIQSISENILQLKPHFDQLVSFKKKRLERVEEILDQIEEEVGEKTRQVLIGFLSGIFIIYSRI